MQGRVNTNLTGLIDTDQQILSQIDIMELTNLYNTNRHLRNILNEKSTLNMFSRIYNLSLSQSFHELVDNYENKLISETLPEILSVYIIDYDNARFFKKLLDSIKFVSREYADFEDSDEENDAEEEQDMILNMAKDCIIKRAYKCLIIIGDYVTAVISNMMTEFNNDDFDRTQHLSNLIKTATLLNDGDAIEVMLAWERNLLEPLEYDPVLESLYVAVDENNGEIFNFLLSKLQFGPKHRESKLIKKCMNCYLRYKCSSGLFRAVLGSYDFEYYLDKSVYFYLKDNLHRIYDSKISEEVLGFLSKLEELARRYNYEYIRNEH
jgi:hypothetical protein